MFKKPQKPAEEKVQWPSQTELNLCCRGTIAMVLVINQSLSGLTSGGGAEQWSLVIWQLWESDRHARPQGDTRSWNTTFLLFLSQSCWLYLINMRPEHTNQSDWDHIVVCNVNKKICLFLEAKRQRERQQRLDLRQFSPSVIGGSDIFTSDTFKNILIRVKVQINCRQKRRKYRN